MSSFSIHGVGVSSGIAIDSAHLVSQALVEVLHYQLPKNLINTEIARFSKAIQTVKYDLETIIKTLPEDLGAFVKTHLVMLTDNSLSEHPKAIIKKEQCNAEWAIKSQMSSIVETFETIPDEYLRNRKYDVIQVVERVIKVLLALPSKSLINNKEIAEVDESTLIFVAHDIAPADAILFKEHPLAAFITDTGAATSHTAILAASLNMPAVVALQKAYDLIDDGDIIIVDGGQGVVIVNPSQKVLAEYALRQNQLILEQGKLSAITSNQSISIDDSPVGLYTNIEGPEDLEAVNNSNAAGIGLYRTEYLFMNREVLPDEEEQFSAYRHIAKAMAQKPVTIRTLDVGSDKQIHLDIDIQSNNPALGLRAVRLSLFKPQLFHTQLRAILRASYYGNIKILIPMLSNLAELRQAKLLLQRAKLSLRNESIPFDKNIGIGVLIEVPAAAINASAFAAEVDFLSIGTNDLIQYTLAIDRSNDAVSHLNNPLHPAVLSLIKTVIDAGNKHGKTVCICGEMASNSELTKLLLGMGLREFSMHPSHILKIKQQILHSNISKLIPMARKVLKNDDIDTIELLVSKMNL